MSEGEKKGWFARLKAGLSRSSGSLTERIASVVTKRRLDADTLEELEEALIMADLGVETSAALVQAVAKGRFGKEVSDVEIREALAAAVAVELDPVAEPLPHRARFRPQVVLVCGVNGTGKTTTIGKLANQAVGAGLKVVLAACDTFRAAAVEQLQVWGQRNGVPVIRGKEGADPAGLAFDAFEQARAQGADLLLIDTAGRLHNKQALMDELRKIIRVLKKVDPEAPHDTVLVLDATTGQNAHNQVEIFKELVDLSGLIVTKLDGTAKGGVVVALARRFGLPIHAIGVGEAIDDLRSFEATAFARALLGLESVKGS
ncbi:MAG: signal recognition particle-docking protein FtsY [Geminicoccaceae bacterium]